MPSQWGDKGGQSGGSQLTGSDACCILRAAGGVARKADCIDAPFVASFVRGRVAAASNWIGAATCGCHDGGGVLDGWSEDDCDGGSASSSEGKAEAAATTTAGGVWQSIASSDTRAGEQGRCGRPRELVRGGELRTYSERQTWAVEDDSVLRSCSSVEQNNKYSAGALGGRRCSLRLPHAGGWANPRAQSPRDDDFTYGVPNHHCGCSASADRLLHLREAEPFSVTRPWRWCTRAGGGGL